MKTSLQTVLLLVSIVAAPTKECPDRCSCETIGVLICSGKDLTHPPSGYFPEIIMASLNDNKIAVLHKHALTGFPMVNFIDLGNNELEEVDLEVFVALRALQCLDMRNNNIDSLTASSGVRLESLQDIYLHENNLISLDPDVFLAAPNLKRLFLSDNPIVVFNGQPILNHPSIIHMEMEQANLGALGDSSFSGLPKLNSLHLISCGITNITGAFVNNDELQKIVLLNNSIAEVTAGTFAKNSQLLLLDLEENPLFFLDASAVDDVMATTGHIGIDSSPLACGCGYENLHWWAKSKGVSISARCNDDPNWCTFTKTPNEEL